MTNNITADELARIREVAHTHNRTKRLYEDKNLEERIGAAGEIAFGNRYGLQVDTSPRPYGDNKIDFNTSVASIDVKTYRKPYNLLIKEHEINSCADVLVLAKYVDDNTVDFLGWINKEAMRDRPTKDFGIGVRSYYLPADKLKPMAELDEFFSKFKAIL